MAVKDVDFFYFYFFLNRRQNVNCSLEIFRSVLTYLLKDFFFPLRFRFGLSLMFIRAVTFSVFPLFNSFD